ncbi:MULTISPECIES: YtxH domain-containing protein [Streptococcus]|uniref:YtxH domain-containing protein n=1 Tax=Streptococcus TaxID=1301 RepID=UPI000CF5560D|nr:YtxH domain-containing protein [Streptococcus suis]
MVKKSSIVTSLLLGAAGGAAAAAFLATKTGKAVKDKVISFANDYKENHEEINADIVSKAQDLGKQATDKFTEVKSQLETGELTVEDLVQTGKEKSKDLFESIKSKTVHAPTVDEEDVEDAVIVSEDIEMDIADVVIESVVEAVEEDQTSETEL